MCRVPGTQRTDAIGLAAIVAIEQLTPWRELATQPSDVMTRETTPNLGSHVSIVNEQHIASKAFILSIQINGVSPTYGDIALNAVNVVTMQRHNATRFAGQSVAGCFSGTDLAEVP